MRRDVLTPILVLALGGCGGHDRLPSPAQTDEALEEGRVLALPIQGDWPRLGLQWTYEVRASGFPSGEKFPPKIAYRLTAKDDMGHPWSGFWMYGKGRGMGTTGATIRDDYVFFHPPRLDEFGFLEYAPFPEGSPGKAGYSETTMTLGKGYGEEEGKKVRGVTRDLGWGKVEGPAGAFDHAWHVEGEVPAAGNRPAWKAVFWWVQRVGWVTMEWTGSAGQRLELRLTAVHDVRAMG